MRAALAILSVCVPCSLHAQTFTLVRSEIKTSPTTTSGGRYQIAGSANPTSTRSTAGNLSIEGGFTSLTFNPPVPSLARIQFTPEAGNLRLFWPTVATGFYLESAADLRAPTWSIVNPQRETVGVNTTVAVPAAPGQNYFRLRHASSLP